MTKVTIAYTDDYLNWKLGSGDGKHPTNAVRAKLAVDILKSQLSEDQIEMLTPTFEEGDREKLLEVHSPEYVAEVLDYYISNEWDYKSKENAETAGVMFSGTVRLVEKLLAGERLGFNPQGAKHHAHRDYSSGFCVFNDMAWAALEFKKAGLKVAYVDWDAHAGDGVQYILRNEDIPTFSIHGHGIFPALTDTSLSGVKENNYLYMNEEEHWYNYNLLQGQGDDAFAWAIEDIAERLEEYAPDVILLATGADGHEEEYWGLKYTLDGYVYAASVIADVANQFGSKVLIGGAGGYQPYTWTPRIWAEVVQTISNNLN